MPAIQLLNIDKRFTGTPVLKNVSLTMDAGERWALVGRSGAGKTTLLRILCGLEPADSGTILVHGRDVTRDPPRDRHAALVTQDYPLYPQLTVLQNMQSALASVSLPRGESNARIEEALGWFEISDLRQRFPSQLSGGQAQRVALARALIRRPAMLLLDEPLSQVDVVWRHDIRELILAATRRFETCLVMVTHDSQDALLMATHIAVLHAGEIVQHGSPNDLYHRPNSPTVANLLSPFGVNWLTVRQGGTEGIQIVPEGTADSELNDSELNDSGVRRSKWLLGIRPDQLLPEHSQRPKSLPPLQLSMPQPCPGVRLQADITTIQDCGFAQLGRGHVGNQPLRIIDRNHALHLGPMRLIVPNRHCMWIR